MKKWLENEDEGSSLSEIILQLTEDGKIDQIKQYFQGFKLGTQNLDSVIRKCLSRFEEQS